MAMLYASAVINGTKTWAQVPANLKQQVKAILETEGVGHLAE